jgi:hypothetical protein
MLEAAEGPEAKRPASNMQLELDEVMQRLRDQKAASLVSQRNILLFKFEKCLILCKNMVAAIL